MAKRCRVDAEICFVAARAKLGIIKTRPILFPVFIAFAAILPLSGCTTPYVPDVSGPAATIKVDMNNDVGDGSLNLALPREHTLLHSVLQNSAGGGEAKASTVVPAGQVLLFDYTESLGSARCDVNVSLVVKPDQTYMIFVGDTPPSPRGNSFIFKILPHIDPYAGSRCFFKGFQVAYDGSLEPLVLRGW